MTTEGLGSFKCPRCGATTWGALDYCSECGMYLYKECPKCGKPMKYTIAASNGHIWAKCTTEGCLAMIQ